MYIHVHVHVHLYIHVHVRAGFLLEGGGDKSFTQDREGQGQNYVFKF